MNPYLEQDGVWRDFHVKFLTAVNERLVPQVRPKYFVKLEEHIYVHELPPEPRRLLGRADLLVASPQAAPGAQVGAGLVEAPAQVELTMQDVERVPFLEARDRHGGELITVLELLSPSNQRPRGDRDPYCPGPRIVAGQSVGQRARPRTRVFQVGISCHSDSASLSLGTYGRELGA